MERNSGQPFRDVAVHTLGRIEQLDLPLALLRERAGDEKPDRPVYPYVVATVKSRRGALEQTGGSPNFQGGMITLCDCKHYLRSFATVCNPRGVWIAGITPPGVTTQHRRYLFYLMYATRVSSHAELWQHLPRTTREAKSAARDLLGDVYEPIAQLHGDAAFTAENYRRPIDGHVHGRGTWRRDIEQTYGERHPCLLFGATTLSFIWTRPRLSLVERLPLSRNPASSPTISAFLSRLRDDATGA